MDYNPVLMVIILVLIGVLGIYWVFRNVSNKKIISKEIASSSTMHAVLMKEVSFYQQLTSHQQQLFMQRIGYFLQTTKISAEKGAIITEADTILLAASATIPLFHFDHWSYENLDEVLVYPGTFNEDYETESRARNILGMVGDGVMHRKMIISLEALRAGFKQASTGNTAIHEFVHLIDKADGDIDGVPQYLIPKDLLRPWIKEMHETIDLIRKNKSDIRDYAATNEAEFLAVVSEYFFQKPKLLKTDHPELYALLHEIYSRQPVQ